MATAKQFSATAPSTAYDQDYYLWFVEQARLLKAGRVGEIDSDRIAEELEDMGKSERRALVAHYTVLLAHLLKWQYQPERRGTSWQTTIKRCQRAIRSREADSPSLKAQMVKLLAEAYENARFEASAETGLPDDIFPRDCPFALDALRNGDLPTD